MLYIVKREAGNGAEEDSEEEEEEDGRQQHSETCLSSWFDLIRID